MGILSDFFIADSKQAAGYPEKPVAKADVAAFRGLSYFELSMLWAIAEQRPWSVELLQEFECVRNENEGEMMVHRLPRPLVALLAKLDGESAQAVTEEWARTEEMASSPEDVRPIVDALSRLARRVELDPAKFLYLFMSV